MATETIGIDPLVADYFQGLRADKAYYELNDLYLSIQSGKTVLTKKVYFQLDNLLSQVYPQQTEPEMHEHWWSDFRKLPGWLNV